MPQWIILLQEEFCGSPFGRKIWNSNDERQRRVVWRCNKKYVVKGVKGCENKHIANRVLYKVFIEAFNTMIENILLRYKAGEF